LRFEIEIDVAQMRHVGKRVIQLLFRKRPAAPVSEARRLVDLDALGAVDELIVGDGIAEAANHRGNLRVEDRMRDEAAAVVDNLDILARGMEDFENGRIGHQLEEWLEVETLG